MTITWIIVGDRTGVKVLEHRSGEMELSRVSVIENPEGRLKDSELKTDRGGSSFSTGSFGRNTMEKEETPSEHVLAQFCRRVAEYLRQARSSSQLDELVLVGEPHFLGRLAGVIEHHIRGLHLSKIPKNLCHLPDAEIYDEVKEVLSEILSNSFRKKAGLS